MKKVFILLAIIIFLLILVTIGWKIPYYLKLESIKLPDNCEIIYDTKVEYTDVYNGYILCEKVVKCDKGSEYVEQYIRENNSSNFANKVHTNDYFGILSDTIIYYWEFDDNFDINNMSNEEKRKYVHIVYRED